MESHQAEIADAVAGVRDELSALRVALDGIEEARRGTGQRAAAFEADVVGRLVASEQRVAAFEADVVGRIVASEHRVASIEAGLAQLQHVLPRIEQQVLELRQELLARLETLDAKGTRLEAGLNDALRFVNRVRNLPLFRVRRRVLRRLGG